MITDNLPLRRSTRSATMGRMETKYPTSHRLSPEALRLLAALAQKLAINQTAVLEVAIREKARFEGVK
jgi:hypothetical protein